MLGIILAAGKGTRMKSDTPKVMHQLANRPFVEWVMDGFVGLMKDKTYDKIAVVAGDDMPELEQFVKDWGNTKEKEVAIVYQRERLGSGHAVKMAMPEIESTGGDEPVFILSGDVPLIQPETLEKMRGLMQQENTAGVVLTVKLDDPTGYGRVIKDDDGAIRKIVEEKDATDEQRQIKEINSGIYLIKASILAAGLKELTNDNAQGEYYLTDIIAWMDKRGEKVLPIQTVDRNEVAGINNRFQLSGMEKVLRKRINKAHMLNGVTIIDPDTVYIDPGVTIGRDSTIHPMTVISGGTVIGERCTIGPMTQINDSMIKADVRVERSHVQQAEIRDNVKVGPFARIREKTLLKEGVKIGDFVETKKTVMGKRSKAQHLTYLGDTEVGEDVNVGAGTITCNYDGFNKHRTRIDDGAFIGSNTSLVAPVSVGRGAIIGAGSVIVKDVGDDALAIARGKQVQKPKRAKELRKKLKKEGKR